MLLLRISRTVLPSNIDGSGRNANIDFAIRRCVHIYCVSHVLYYKTSFRPEAAGLNEVLWSIVLSFHAYSGRPTTIGHN